MYQLHIFGQAWLDGEPVITIIFFDTYFELLDYIVDHPGLDCKMITPEMAS